LKADIQPHKGNVRFGSKADICIAKDDVCFAREADIRQTVLRPSTGLLRSLSLNTTASMLSGVFEKLANPLTGRRNIGCLLVARNSSYYSTNIVDRPESFRTEWRRTYPDGSCSFDRGGRQTVRHSKRRLAVGRRSADIA